MRVIDGHNDALHRVWEAGGSLLDDDGAVNVAAAREGGLVAGLFAIWCPSDDFELDARPGGWSVAPFPELDRERAARDAREMAAKAFSDQVRLIRDAGELEQDGPLGIVLHLEGAEPIGEDLEELERWYELGLRSLGPVWSRPNRFGDGVQFRFPSSPDTGGGLTPAGERLIRRCEQLGIAVDLSHLTERGFWDAARVLDGPLIASHSSVHALSPNSRNLTDEQIRAVALVGINYEVSMLRADGDRNPDTPLDTLVEHVRYVAELAGVEHVALGSDFDGATMPRELQTARELPRLVERLKREFSDDEVAKICHGNWQRVLKDAWR